MVKRRARRPHGCGLVEGRAGLASKGAGQGGWAAWFGEGTPKPRWDGDDGWFGELGGWAGRDRRRWGGGGGIRIKRDEVGGRGTVERGVLLLLLLCDLEATGGRRQERSDGVPVLQ